jgi:hypothetical protein
MRMAVVGQDGLDVRVRSDGERGVDADVCQSCKAPTLIDATTLGLVSPPPYKGYRSITRAGKKGRDVILPEVRHHGLGHRRPGQSMCGSLSSVGACEW